MPFVPVLKPCMENDSLITVQVCYIDVEHQFLTSVSIASGSSISKAIALSGFAEAFPAIELAKLKVGIYSKIKSLSTVVRPGDRIEIYRPLQVDPMLARRRRAGTRPAKANP